MSLQEQIAEAIIIAFDELGGDPQDAINAALRHDTVDSWLQQETAITAFAGGAEMAVPGLHALTIPAGISYLIRQMARISWGIGALKDNYIVETPQHSDLRNILTLWANSSYFNAHILEHLAVSVDAFEYVLTDEGYERLQTLLTHAEKLNPVTKTLTALDNLLVAFGADERSQYMMQSLTGKTSVEELVLSAKDRTPFENAEWMRQPMNDRISTKLALNLSTRISARVPARLIMGFVPIAGAVVNAFFNASTLQSMADSAIKYYDNPMTAAILKGNEDAPTD